MSGFLNRRILLRTWLVLLVLSGGTADNLRAASPPSAPESPSSDAPSEPDTGNRHVWEPKTKSVAVFKNGLGFFTREASVQLRDGWSYAREVPPAAFGTLAIYAHSETQTVDLVGTGPGEVVAFDGHDAPRDLDSKRQRLESCRGLTVELQYERQGAPKSAAGALVSVGTDYVVLEGPSETFAVPLESIRELRVLDMPLRVHVSGADGEPATEARLGVAYLRKGILWVPEYTLNVIDEETAELVLRGTLVNEAEDLVHCDVNFIVGVPHFVHSELLSPIAVGRVIRTLGTAMAQGAIPPQVMTQMMNRAAIATNSLSSQTGEGERAVLEPAVVDSGDLSGVISSLPQLENAAAGDFTVYTKSDLTVRRGERAIVTLFTKKVRYRHLYRWEAGGDVKHFLTLENATPTAWTTGPCLTLSSGNPLSEDVLKYTPRGGRGELQVTTAVNIAHAQTENETDRQLKAHSPNHNQFYDLVTIAGELHLKNFESKPVELRIDAPIQGRPIEAAKDGMIQIDATKLRLIERAGSIRWSLVLEPGEEIRLPYRYERYVPSN